jgi:citrate synthase
MDDRLQTSISYADRENIRWRGYDLMTEILGKQDFAETMYLLITGRLPENWEKKIFDACLITLMEHGLTPHAIVTRLVADSNPEQIQVAIASGLMCVGDVFAGTMEGCGLLLLEGLDRSDREAWCRSVAEDHKQRKRALPGFGHPLHKPDDPRSKRLFEIAEEAGAKGDVIALLKQLGGVVDDVYGRHLTINATGALAALLLEIGIEPYIMRGVAVTSRAAGLTAHIAEEHKSRSGRKIWNLVENEFSYTSGNDDPAEGA